MKKYKYGGPVPDTKKFKIFPLLPGERIEVKRLERKDRAKIIGYVVQVPIQAI